MSIYPTSGDYKYDIQLIAEELAKRDYGKDFYQCTPDQQYQLFLAATESWLSAQSSQRECPVSDELRQVTPSALFEELAEDVTQTCKKPFRSEVCTAAELEIIASRIADRLWYLQKCAEEREKS